MENARDKPKHTVWSGWFAEHSNKTALKLILAALVLFMAALLLLQRNIDAHVQDFVRGIADDAIALGNAPSATDQIQLAIAISQRFAETVREIKLGELAYDICIHLTIAFLVAAIVIWAIEKQIRSVNQKERVEFANEISLNVFQAIGNRLVPKEIIEQLISVLQADFVKRRVIYTITLRDVPGRFVAQDKNENDWILIKREVRYFIDNVSKRENVYPFMSEIFTTVDKKLAVKISENDDNLPFGEELTFPRHAQLNVGGLNIPIEDPTTVKFGHDIPLAPGRSPELVHTYYEILRKCDETYYAQKIPVIGLELVIHNNISGRISIEEVHLTHPQRKEFKPQPSTGTDQRWIFPDNKAIMPGQMFSIRWKENTENTRNEVPLPT